MVLKYHSPLNEELTGSRAGVGKTENKPGVSHGDKNKEVLPKK